MISHKHRTIFIHIPKCGGTSVEQAVINDLGPYTTHTKRALLLQRNTEPNCGPPCLAHMSADEYRDYNHVPAWMWADYWKFGLVRNPFHRVASFYRYLQADKTMSFRDFVLKQYPIEWEQRYWMVRPQAFFLSTSNRAPVNAVFKLEEIYDHWPAILLNMDMRQPLGHELKQIPVSDYSKWFNDDDVRETVQRLYAIDFEQYDYSRP